MYHVLAEDVLVRQDIDPQEIASGASVNGGGQDAQGYETLMAIINVGTATTGNVTVKLQESSDDGSTDAYADITSATTPAVGPTTDEEPYLIELNLSERERYIRAVATVAGGGAVLVGVAFALGRARHRPPSQDNTVVFIGHEA